MIPPQSLLYIYEIQGDMKTDFSAPPNSFIGIWNEEGFSYLFFTKAEDDYVRIQICPDGSTFSSRHEMTYLDWQTGLPPQGIRLGGLIFVPCDHPCPPPDAVLLDPSVVFGDGNHPTTASCLRFMEEIVKTETVQSMLDLGTGTGILALAAAAMGVEHVVAVDKNRLAVRTAVNNVMSNSFSTVIEVYEAEARLFIDKPFDLVAANLPFHVLRDLVTMRGMASHRFWIVSGINQEQAEVIQGLFDELGYIVCKQCADSPWVTFTMAGRDDRKTLLKNLL